MTLTERMAVERFDLEQSLARAERAVRECGETITAGTRISAERGIRSAPPVQLAERSVPVSASRPPAGGPVTRWHRKMSASERSSFIKAVASEWAKNCEVLGSSLAGYVAGGLSLEGERGLSVAEKARLVSEQKALEASGSSPGVSSGLSSGVANNASRFMNAALLAKADQSVDDVRNALGL